MQHLLRKCGHQSAHQYHAKTSTSLVSLLGQAQHFINLEGETWPPELFQNREFNFGLLVSTIHLSPLVNFFLQSLIAFQFIADDSLVIACYQTFMPYLALLSLT